MSDINDQGVHLLRAALPDDEPPTPDLPGVLTAARAAGTRMRRRRRLAVGAVTLTGAALLAGGVSALTLTGRDTSAPSAQSAPTTPTASATTLQPRLVPVPSLVSYDDMSGDRLLAALRNHLPPGVTSIATASNLPYQYIVTRADGSQVGLVPLQTSDVDQGEQPLGCIGFSGKNCRHTLLPNGDQAITGSLDTKDNNVAEVWFATPQGVIRGLVSESALTPTTPPLTGAPLSPDELMALLSQPDVYNAVVDEPASAP